MPFSLYDIIQPVRHGLLLSVLALMLGIGWAGYLAINHEQLHGGFEKQEQAASHGEHALHQTTAPWAGLMIPEANAHGNEPHAAAPSEAKGAGHAHQHSHSGSLATDAMQRLLRGHIHWMGLGILSTVLLLLIAFTSLKSCWKALLGWTFGLGALAYPLAWILMGFRTVTLGPDMAEQSVTWLFAPAAGAVLVSLIAAFCVIAVDMLGWQRRIPLGRRLFDSPA